MQLVATTFLKLIKEIWRPLGLVFVGVVILGAGFCSMIIIERLGESAQEHRHGVGVNQIEHRAFAAGRGPFDFLRVQLLGNGIDFCAAFGSDPIH